MQSGNSEYIALTKDFTKGWNTLEFDFSTEIQRGRWELLEPHQKRGAIFFLVL